MDFISIDGLRADGRRPLELRHMECAVGTSDRPGCDGSATMSMGLSKARSCLRSLPHWLHSRAALWPSLRICARACQTGW